MRGKETSEVVAFFLHTLLCPPYYWRWICSEYHADQYITIDKTLRFGFLNMKISTSCKSYVILSEKHCIVTAAAALVIFYIKSRSRRGCISQAVWMIRCFLGVITKFEFWHLYWRLLLLFFMVLELWRLCCNKNKGNTLALFEIHIVVYAILFFF